MVTGDTGDEGRKVTATHRVQAESGGGATEGGGRAGTAGLVVGARAVRHAVAARGHGHAARAARARELIRRARCYVPVSCDIVIAISFKVIK